MHPKRECHLRVPHNSTPVTRRISALPLCKICSDYTPRRRAYVANIIEFLISGTGGEMRSGSLALRWKVWSFSSQRCERNFARGAARRRMTNMCNVACKSLRCILLFGWFIDDVCRCIPGCNTPRQRIRMMNEDRDIIAKRVVVRCQLMCEIAQCAMEFH